MKRETNPKIVGIIFSTLGIILLTASFFVCKNMKNFIAISEKADGIVVDVVSRGAKSRSYYPVVSFTARDGREYRFEGGIGSNPPDYSTHDRLKVLYDPSNPKTASIDTFFQKWFATAILFILGFIFSAIGIVLSRAVQFK